jgi:hypothetical protein
MRCAKTYTIARIKRASRLSMELEDAIRAASDRSRPAQPRRSDSGTPQASDWLRTGWSAVSADSCGHLTQFGWASFPA